MRQNLSLGEKVVLDFYITINLIRFFKHFSLNECFVLKFWLHMALIRLFLQESILVLSDLKLLANVISRQQKLSLAWKGLERFSGGSRGIRLNPLPAPCF